MSREPLALVEAILEEIGDERFVVGEGDETVADVARRQDAEFFLQAARTAAVVGDGDDRGEITRRPFETAQERGETRSAADRDDLVAAAQAAIHERVDDAPALRRRDRGDDRAHPLSDPEHDHRRADRHERVRERAERKTEIARERVDRFVRVDLRALGDEPAPDTVIEKRGADEREEEPAFHAEADREPACEVGDARPRAHDVASSRKSHATVVPSRRARCASRRFAT